MNEHVLKYSTKKQLERPQRLFCPIISIDHLSQDFQDLPVDDILALGDQALLRKFVYDQMAQSLLSQSIDESEVFGPLVNYLHRTLASLKKPDPQSDQRERRSCEILLYLSGHGTNPGNLCLVPNRLKPHPARKGLNEMDAENWYVYEDSAKKKEEEFLCAFYEAVVGVVGEYRGPLGFVGGEVYIHQRGYIGILGVLGLWCHTHWDRRGQEDAVFHHLVIVADCCFSGIWGNTLKCIMESEADNLREYRQLLQDYPVSIQCATYDCEASHGGLFTPLWYFLNTSHPSQLDRYHRAYEVDRLVRAINAEEPAPPTDDATVTLEQRKPRAGDDFETQHPWYISTSKYRPSWEFFDDTDFFIYLHGAQLRELENDLKIEYNRNTLDDALVLCKPDMVAREPKFSVLPFDQDQSMTTNEVIQIAAKNKSYDEKYKCFSPLVRPLVFALAGVVCNQRKLYSDKIKEIDMLSKVKSFQQQELLLATRDKEVIEQRCANLSNVLFESAWRFCRALHCFTLDERGILSQKNRQELLKQLQPPCDAKNIQTGVYVFQGGVGDMSLIVTPDQEVVILIDGTKTADCFIAAWNSTLRYLRRITHIVVTHHDEDHTFGIQLLLARYCLDHANLPDLKDATIYMNTRADVLRHRNFRHEKEIQILASRLRKQQNSYLTVTPMIIQDKPIVFLKNGYLLLVAILPTQSLVQEVKDDVPETGKRTKPVGTRGRTTAANVLSINVVAVWKDRDAYLFTGDAHLMDVTEAAQDFLKLSKIECFKYVDVPHHGSAHSNVTDVDGAHRGLAGIPADNYLISHNGNHQNPSFQTVTDILRSDKCQKLHFLYPQRERALSCRQHGTCRSSWHCPQCVEAQDQQDKIDTRLHANGLYKFFSFD